MKMYLLFQMLLGFQLTALKLTFILAAQDNLSHY
jgi:hypothetical protein